MHATTPNVTVLGFSPAEGPVRFSGLLKPHVWRFVLGLFFLIITNLVMVVIPRLINIGVQIIEGKSLDPILLSQDFYVDVTSMNTVVVLLCILAAFGAVARTLSRQTLFNVGRDIERDLRSKLFYHLSTLSSSFYARRSVGDLMNHLTSDIGNIRMSSGFAALNFLNIVIIFSATVPILISMDWLVALAALSPFLLVMLAAQTLTGKMFSRVKENQAALSKLTSHVQENLSGAQIVRVFHQEEAEEKKFAVVNQQTFEAALRLAKIRVVMFPLMRMMGGLGVAMTLFVGGREVALGNMTVGDYVEVNARLLQLAWPAISFGFIMSVYSQGKASLSRINELLLERPDIIDGSYHSDVLKISEVKNLGVSVGANHKKVLHDLSFTLRPGQVLGVVGPSGSGKSTLLRALSLEIPISRGEIFYDGVDALDYNLESLHRQIAVVSSEPFLFSATLRENITFARPDASEQEVLDVIEKVGLTRDLASFGEGLNTMVGERGVMLSGGQRQRVALARAIVAKPSLLLLDDSLSAVDSETEMKIVSALSHRNVSGSLVIVSHRLSAVRQADEILVLDKGHVVERGHHTQLIQQGKLYAALWGVEQLQESLNHG